ncbi:MAG: hypothetical protein WC977_14075 [Anaerovoracaceae bacterium]|jgi:hypothetical protein
MQHNRNIRVSIKEHVKSAFTTNVGVGGLGVFNVYGENQLPQRSPSFSPTRPCLWLVDSNIEPTKADLPLVVLEITPIRRRTLELGRKARIATLNIHVYGRNRGERDDIASYLQDWLDTSGSGTSVPITDYSADGGSRLDTGYVQDVDVYTVSPIPESQREEASLANVDVVNCEIIFKQR